MAATTTTTATPAQRAVLGNAVVLPPWPSVSTADALAPVAAAGGAIEQAKLIPGDDDVADAGAASATSSSSLPSPPPQGDAWWWASTGAAATAVVTADSLVSPLDADAVGLVACCGGAAAPFVGSSSSSAVAPAPAAVSALPVPLAAVEAAGGPGAAAAAAAEAQTAASSAAAAAAAAATTPAVTATTVLGPAQDHDDLAGSASLVPWQDKGVFVVTKSGHLIAQRPKALLAEPGRIRLGARAVVAPGVRLRGDVTAGADPKAVPAATIVCGQFLFVGTGTVVAPTSRRTRGAGGAVVVALVPAVFGAYVTIGRGCRIEAAQIGNHVCIGDGAVVGPRCVLRDSCKILPGAVLPADTVVAKGAIWGGAPAGLVGETPPGYAQQRTALAKALYQACTLE